MLKIGLFLLIIHSSLAIATPLNIGVGLGQKYGGLSGGQVSISNEKNNVRLALGIVGISAGYDFKPFNKFSFGVTYGQYLEYESASALNMSYYFSGEFQTGWNLSLDLGRATRNPLYGCNSEDCGKRIFTKALSLGYTF